MKKLTALSLTFFFSVAANLATADDLCARHANKALDLFTNIAEKNVSLETLLANNFMLYTRAKLCTQECTGNTFRSCSNILTFSTQLDENSRRIAGVKLGRLTPNNAGGFYDHKGDTYKLDSSGVMVGNNSPNLIPNGSGAFTNSFGKIILPDGSGGYLYVID